MIKPQKQKPSTRLIYAQAQINRLAVADLSGTRKHITSIPVTCLLFLVLLCSLQNALAGNANVVYQPIFDDKTNMVMAKIPLPPGWKIIKKTDPDQPSIEGPNDIRVYDFPTKIFSYSEDPNMQMVYRQSGQQMRRPPGLVELIKQDLGPIAEEEGLQYVRHYSIPELATKDKEYNARLYRVMPVQSSFDVLVTEWKDQEGSPSVLILHYFKHLAQGTVDWGYYGSYLAAPAAQFKQAKRALINGLLNTRYNPAQIQAYNRMEAQKAQSSMSAHQRRMQNNQANFEASQNAFRSSSDAINKSIMDSYNSQNAASDRGQRQFINSIRDENTVYDAGNGQSYQVESGANQYWMNNDREYIPSSDTLYNPNQDQNINQQEWREVEIRE